MAGAASPRELAETAPAWLAPGWVGWLHWSLQHDFCLLQIPGNAQNSSLSMPLACVVGNKTFTRSLGKTFMSSQSKQGERVSANPSKFTTPRACLFSWWAKHPHSQESPVLLQWQLAHDGSSPSCPWPAPQAAKPGKEKALCFKSNVKSPRILHPLLVTDSNCEASTHGDKGIPRDRVRKGGSWHAQRYSQAEQSSWMSPSYFKINHLMLWSQRIFQQDSCCGLVGPSWRAKLLHREVMVSPGQQLPLSQPHHC